MYTYIHTCIYKTESLCYTSETLQVNFNTSVKKSSPPLPKLDTRQQMLYNSIIVKSSNWQTL